MVLHRFVFYLIILYGLCSWIHFPLFFFSSSMWFLLNKYSTQKISKKNIFMLVKWRKHSTTHTLSMCSMPKSNSRMFGFVINHMKCSSSRNNRKKKIKKKMDKKSYYNFWCRVNWADSTTTTVFKDILIHSEYRINVARPNNQPKDRFYVCMCWNIILFVIWFVKLKQTKKKWTNLYETGRIEFLLVTINYVKNKN